MGRAWVVPGPRTGCAPKPAPAAPGPSGPENRVRCRGGCFCRNPWPACRPPDSGALGLRAGGTGAPAEPTGVLGWASPPPGPADRPRTDLLPAPVEDFLLHVPTVRSALLLSLCQTKPLTMEIPTASLQAFPTGCFLASPQPCGVDDRHQPARDTEAGLPGGEGTSQVAHPSRPQRSQDSGTTPLQVPCVSPPSWLPPASVRLTSSSQRPANHQCLSPTLLRRRGWDGGTGCPGW